MRFSLHLSGSLATPFQMHFPSCLLTRLSTASLCFAFPRILAAGVSFHQKLSRLISFFSKGMMLMPKTCSFPSSQTCFVRHTRLVSKVRLRLNPPLTLAAATLVPRNAVENMSEIVRLDCGKRLSEATIHNKTVYLAGQVCLFAGNVRTSFLLCALGEYLHLFQDGRADI